MRRSALLAMALVAAACAPGATDDTSTTTSRPETTTTSEAMTTSTQTAEPMTIFTPAFSEGEVIPVKYTCDGEDVSPRLDVLNIPGGAVSLVLIVDDPDAPVGTWDHWVEYDIEIPEGGATGFAEGAPVLGIKGVNSWNLTGYGGPCPPPGQNHRYFFKVFALDGRLLLPEGVDSSGVRTAMEGHIIAEASVMGTYSR